MAKNSQSGGTDRTNQLVEKCPDKQMDCEKGALGTAESNIELSLTVREMFRETLI